MIEHIDGQLFKKMVIEGAQTLENNKQIVNALNVFPVPDGDTGTNMSLTMQSAVREVKSKSTDSLESIAECLANGSLMGARGNSGVILSQLFRGFAKGAKGKKTLNVKDLADILKFGADTAYKAVMKPVEGTILTVARESAEKALLFAETETNLVTFMEKVIAAAEDTLNRTPDMLKVLKDAGVVDSGGKGLLYFYMGTLAALTGKTTVIDEEPVMEFHHHHEEEISGDIEFGYCTEFIIHGENVDTDALKNKLMGLGDSLLVVGNESVVKVHIHTNHPGEALEHALAVGYLGDIKIDNMRLQAQPHKNEVVKQAEKPQKKPFGIITVTMGNGLTKLFKDLGADHAIEGGQTMNPSTEDFIKAIDNIDADTIYLLPNNSNIIMAANQAKELSEKTIMVIPSKSVPQGITALLNFNPEATGEENQEAMIEALKSVKTGQVTYAVRDTSYNDIIINKDDILGIGDGAIQAAGKGVAEVSLELLKKIVTEDDEMITLFYGEDVKEEAAEALLEEIESTFPQCDVEIYYGGQPLYYYIFSVE
ncbi:DAK2 domain-containing protein [Alkaliphilus transvaalensis]|uniref:DAK2 domain-containing protein n=1 Tax=Alkaliphilus transvaalensis TaxID=114628 RepID=UPI00047B4F5E